MVEFGCVGAEIKWDTVLVLWFCGFVVLWFVVLHRKIRPTQLWVELSWVVATKNDQCVALRDLDSHTLTNDDNHNKM